MGNQVAQVRNQIEKKEELVRERTAKLKKMREDREERKKEKKNKKKNKRKVSSEAEEDESSKLSPEELETRAKRKKILKRKMKGYAWHLIFPRLFIKDAYTRASIRRKRFIEKHSGQLEEMMKNIAKFYLYPALEKSLMELTEEKGIIEIKNDPANKIKPQQGQANALKIIVHHFFSGSSHSLSLIRTTPKNSWRN